MRRWSALPVVLAALVTAGGCNTAPIAPGSITVHAPADLAPGTALAVDDLVADLGRVAQRPVQRVAQPAPRCRAGEVHIQVLGHSHSDLLTQDPHPALGPQDYTIDEERCGADGRRVVLRGGSLLAGQWAVYDLLTRLGVRYLHPEQTLYPTRLAWPDAPLRVRSGPAFQFRAIHVHRTHPIELSPPLVLGDLDMAAYQRRWIDWNVKLRQTAVGGWDPEFARDHAFVRGFPRETGFVLLNSQQGYRPVLDPDDPRPESEQIAAAIEERMAPVPGLPAPEILSFQFNPSEFTEADDRATVERLTFIANYMAERHPGVDLYTINHGTHAAPTPNLGVRFFDLPQFAPPNLGVQVHTLMFYDLDRPAPVYGNTDFRHMLAWARREAQTRRIVHFPESSWWLTFDLPVPLYLAPVTLEARQHDIDLLGDLLSPSPASRTGVYGHFLFSSGQEWGYWLIDYCVALMSWDRAYTHARCLDDFTGALAGAAEIRAVLREVEARQVGDMRDPEIIRFLVGSDDATEAAFDAGIVFHPLPPGPATVLGWSDAQAAALEQRSLAPLRAMARDYHRWADRVEAVLPLQNEAQAPWVREIRDGLRVFALRAEHSAEVYGTALALRAALRGGDSDAIDAARAGVERARAITARAREVVHARERDYRYPPQLTIAGDEPGTRGAVPNLTVYSYRYLSRTHRMFYWERPDRQLAEMFGEGLELVRPSRRILRQTQALEIALLATQVAGLRVDWGDGTVEMALTPHRYARQGLFDWTLDARHSRGVIEHRDRVAVVTRRVVFPRRSLEVAEPMGADTLEGLLPGFVVGLGNDGADFMALGRIDDVEPLAAPGSVVRRERTGDVSGPADLTLSLRNIGTVTAYRARLELGEGTGPTARTLTITGELSTEEIIDLVVRVGGFTREGARRLVASTLGYSPQNLPEWVAFRIRGQGTEETD